ncbi:MAG: arsenite methyltransferase [Thermoplasmata archaeon]|nr:arsenite methyltransferase [Thermoplasmata archaeon]
MKSKKSNAKTEKADRASSEDVRSAVRKRYGQLALNSAPCCGGETNTTCCTGIYPNADVISLPSEAIAVSAGCGNPTAIASLKPGMVVVDLGSGGGIDAFLSAKKVGKKGRVYGIDMTPEMINRARRTAKENGYDNVEFRLGEIEHMPLDAGVADVVISNCVINLSPDKEAVFREAYRVLKPGGKVAISDIVLLSELPDAVREDLGAWSHCVSGAVSEEQYIGAMRKAGFEKIKVEDRVVYSHEQLSGYLRETKLEEDPSLAKIDLSRLVASYRISAVKPKK